MQAGRGIPYRTVMAEALARLAAAERAVGSRLDARTRSGASLPTWPLFPDVPGSLTELRARGWKLGILSNTDPDFLDASLAAIGVPVDLRVVASDIGSYKPAFGHWESFFQQTRRRPIASRPRGGVALPRRAAVRRARAAVRVDQPAGRGRATSRAPASSPTSRGLPDVLDGLVPPVDG